MKCGRGCRITDSGKLKGTVISAVRRSRTGHTGTRQRSSVSDTPSGVDAYRFVDRLARTGRRVLQPQPYGRYECSGGASLLLRSIWSSTDGAVRGLGTPVCCAVTTATEVHGGGPRRVAGTRCRMPKAIDGVEAVPWSRSG